MDRGMIGAVLTYDTCKETLSANYSEMCFVFLEHIKQ